MTSKLQDYIDIISNEKCDGLIYAVKYRSITLATTPALDSASEAAIPQTPPLSTKIGDEISTALTPDHQQSPRPN